MVSENDEAAAVLAHLHNMGYLSEDKAVGIKELKEALSIDDDVLRRVLEEHVNNGYVSRVITAFGEELYYLTGKGIIRVCSIYT
jgi:CTP-dependent riboflavin kinase